MTPDERKEMLNKFELAAALAKDAFLLDCIFVLQEGEKVRQEAEMLSAEIKKQLKESELFLKKVQECAGTETENGDILF